PCGGTSSTWLTARMRQKSACFRGSSGLLMRYFGLTTENWTVGVVTIVTRGLSGSVVESLAHMLSSSSIQNENLSFASSWLSDSALIFCTLMVSRDSLNG